MAHIGAWMVAAAACSLSLTLAAGAAQLRDALEPVVDVWILAGQSNMVGENSWADGDTEPMPECGTPWEDKILSYPPVLTAGQVMHLRVDGGSFGTSDVRPALWVPAMPDLASRSAEQAAAGRGSMGPALPFAKRLITAGISKRIGFVPMAVGGSSLCWTWLTLGLQEHLVGQALRAMESLGRGASLRGMLWVQGETDGSTGPGHAGEAARYARNLHQLLREVRRELRPHHPELPVLMSVVGVEGRERAFPFIREVREQQLHFQAPGVIKLDMEGQYEMFAQNVTDRWGWVSDLPSNAGLQYVHLTKQAMCRFGSDLADAYIQSLKGRR